MALTTCNECKKEISTDAKVCPHCGTTKPHQKISTFWLWVIGIFIVGIMSSILTPKTDDKPTQEAQAQASSTSVDNNTSDEQIKKQLADAEKESIAKLSPRAKKLHKKHPDWEADDCERVAHHKAWVGMTKEMLFISYGKPDSTNVSNYGSNNEYQYCYNGDSTQCFYDKTGLGIIDSYN